MKFWRNNNTESFDPESMGQYRILEPLSFLESTHNGDAEPVGIFLGLVSEYLTEQTNIPKSLDRLLLQEYSVDNRTADLRFVINGMGKEIVNSITGGGFKLFVDLNEGYKLDLSLYYHRLVCSNGMIRKTEASGVFHAYSLDEWQLQIKYGHAGAWNTSGRSFQKKIAASKSFGRYMRKRDQQFYAG